MLGDDGGSSVVVVVDTEKREVDEKQTNLQLHSLPPLRMWCVSECV